ncbi:MAG: Fur family transcriptional regulator [Phycisphaerales bacterium]
MSTMPQTQSAHCTSDLSEHSDPRKIFEAHSIRCTRPRVLIYETLCAAKSHPTAEELHQSVRAIQPGISLATIYNTLELLVDQGLARRISNRCPGSGASRYDADQANHLHLVLDDGRVLDAPLDLGKQLTDAIPEGLMAKLAEHAGVSALKIEIVEDTRAAQN